MCAEELLRRDRAARARRWIDPWKLAELLPRKRSLHEPRSARQKNLEALDLDSVELGPILLGLVVVAGVERAVDDTFDDLRRRPVSERDIDVRITLGDGPEQVPESSAPDAATCP